MGHGRRARAATVAVMVLTGSACGGRTGSAVTAPGTGAASAAAAAGAAAGPGAGAAFRAATAATTAALSLIQDDLDTNGNLTVPQNRYNLDVEKLATAIRTDEPRIQGLAVNDRTRSDVEMLISAASGLVADLRSLAPRAGRSMLTEIGMTNSAIAAVQRDLDTAAP